MEIKINKEIRDYTEKIFFGLSLRQFTFSLCACLIAIIVYFSFKDVLGQEIVSWLCIILAFPFIALGFIKYNGMTADKLLINWIKSEILIPKALLFKPENIYEILLKEKEQINDKKKKSRKR